MLLNYLYVDIKKARLLPPTDLTHKSQDPGHTERHLAFECRQTIMDLIAT